VYNEQPFKILFVFTIEGGIAAKSSICISSVGVCTCVLLSKVYLQRVVSPLTRDTRHTCVSVCVYVVIAATGQKG
jgi:hypothetical protein